MSDQQRAATTESATFASAAGDVTARAWAPERIVPVQAIELRCDLPHTCPECGTSWEPVRPGENGRIAEALGADIVEPVEDAVARGAIPYDPRSSGSDDNPHESDGTTPEACAYCGDVWPCAGADHA